MHSVKNQNFRSRIFSTLLSLALVMGLQAQNPPTYTANAAKIQEWKDARFGMFIHWGPVALKGTEIGWSRYANVPVEEYDNLYKQFNPVNFNADEWVSVAKAAGMKYIVLTTKHHDGFCLWPTRQIDHNISKTPFKRDVVKELAEACKKQGIEFGTYYSTTDWYHPDFPLTGAGGKIRKEKSDLDAYTSYLKRQVGELLLNYGPLYVLWFDVPQEFDKVRGQGVLDFVRAIQPDIIVNDRTGAKGDFDSPEQRIGGFKNDRPWETCMTIGDQWAWKANENLKSLEQCLQTLIRTVGGDGNLLFNVGPDASGKIEPDQVARLKEMGAWLDKYGNSVYGTRGGPFKPTDWGVSTRKDSTIFLHILAWQGNKPHIELPETGRKIRKCSLADGTPVKVTSKNGKTILEFPFKALQPINTVVTLKMDSNVMDIKPLEVSAQSVSYKKKITASTNPHRWWYDVESVNNGDWVGHGWRPAKEDKQPWAEIDLGKTEKISSAIIYETGNAVKAFEIQYLVGETWKTAFKGKNFKHRIQCNFKPVNAQKMRLQITNSTDIPEILELIFL